MFSEVHVILANIISRFYHRFLSFLLLLSVGQW